jgi:hypothetical protein
MLLFVGSNQGLVYEYLVDTNHLRTGTFTQFDSNFLQYTVGSNATMQAYDLNADGKMEYLAGCSRGGLQLFSESVWDSSVILSNQTIEPVNNEIRVFPNPANDKLTCLIANTTGGVMQPQVYNLIGQRIDVPYTINQGTIEFSTQALSSGMYVVRVVSGNQTVCVKVIIAHHF